MRLLDGYPVDERCPGWGRAGGAKSESRRSGPKMAGFTSSDTKLVKQAARAFENAVAAQPEDAGLHYWLGKS